MFRLFQSLFGRVQTRRRSVRPTRRECHLTLETLEDRCVPATLLVTSGLDNGAAGTLRYEVAQAHSGDIIDVLPVTTALQPRGTLTTCQNVVLTQGEVMLKVNVTIEGSCQPTISGDGLSRVFEVASGAQATLNDLFITGGVAKGTTGGGILNDKGATVTLNGGILTGNSAASGGGIYNNGGTVIIENYAMVQKNTATNGGGLNSLGGSVQILNSTLYDNSASNGYGGAIAMQDGTLIISGGCLCYNSAYSGAALFNSSNGGSTTIISSALYDNSAVNQGGAIWNPQGTVTVIGDTFSSNSARYGGAIDNAGTLYVGASNFSGNTPNSLFGPYTNEGGNIGL